jgi:ABC-type amino acid transport system permease subunit
MEFIFLMMALYVLINYTMTRVVNWVNRAVALRGHS